MGDVISLSERRAMRASAPVLTGLRTPVVFAFDLASPWTYLAAERVDAQFPRVAWQPVLADALLPATPAERRRDHGEAAVRAAALRLPLVWPESADAPPVPSRAAMRVAHLAAERGRAAAFVLAASRLAFCGGFDLDDPEILAEAAAAAGLQLEPCLRAMGDRERDASMLADGDRLIALGADRLPAFVVGDAVLCGEDRICELTGARQARASAVHPGAS